MKRRLSMIGVSVLMAGLAHSAIIADYSTDFTSADGFSDATSANNIDGWITRAQHVTSATDSYGAMLLGSNGGAMVHAASGGSLDVGDTIRFTVGVFYTDNTQNNRLRIGLRETATATGGVNAGLELNMDAQGDLVVAGYAAGGTHDFGAEQDAGFDYVAGQANGETVIVDITKSATADTFDIDWSYRGGAASGSFTVTHAGLYADAEVFGAMNYNGPTAEAYIDRYSHAVIPEPATIGMVGIFGGAILFARRHLGV
ncbi:hypothetical protein EGM51_00165 [Verrucomicrobia bacterium S94]|nr:hypothetical protein EGM51_00165 [Verrucomicrobia bacterium S94]